MQIAERLRFETEGSIVSSMYVNLLSRAMDKERVGEAHPAFVFIISQLAPDEVLLLEQLASRPVSAFMRLTAIPDKVLLKDERESLLREDIEPSYLKALCDLMVRPEALAASGLLYTYIEHLVSLGIVVYSNHENPDRYPYLQGATYGAWYIKPNELGRLFHSACLRGAS